MSIEDYELVDGIWWSDLSDPFVCERVENELQRKVDDIADQLKLAWEQYEATGTQTDPAWRASARFALNATKDELRKVRTRKAEINRQIKLENAEKTRLMLEQQQAAKLARMSIARSQTEADLDLFKEEVKRRISAAEYDDIWRCVRASKSADAQQAA